MAFDVAVIGGGPAGMMAAGRAAELGARVVLVEGNARPGMKLLMTGNGRCNLANSGLDKSRLVEAYGKNGKFLYSAFSRFGTQETLEFFQRLGLKLKEEGGKVFPASDRAADVLAALMRYLERGAVTILSGERVVGLAKEGDREGDRITKAVMSGGEVRAANFILCTGGKSFPATGSDGGAFQWLKALGHTITPLRPALSPLTVEEGWVREGEGASLRGITLTALQGDKKAAEEHGECVITRNGLSGPAALNLSRKITGLLARGGIKVAIDSMPDTSYEKLDRELVGKMRDNPNRLPRNIIEEFVSPKFAPLILHSCEIDGETKANRLTRTERMKLAQALNGLTLTVKGIKGFERAMVTSGGVSLKEVDSRTMRSKVIPNLFFAGEALDLDGPTGGYNLQVCWTTGWAAGESAAGDIT